MIKVEVERQGFIYEKDRRSIIKQNINNYPYENLLLIHSIDSFNNIVIGTGFLISEYFALTAAHVILNKKGTRHKQTYIFLAPTSVTMFNDKPSSYCKNQYTQLADFRVSKQYLNNLLNDDNTKSQYDFALIKLKKSMKPNNFMKITSISSSQEMAGKQIQICGYVNQQKDNQFQEGEVYDPKTHKDRIVYIKNNRIFYTVDTSEGQSGGPIIWEFNNVKSIIGIHTSNLCRIGNTNRMNAGIYINQLNIQIIYEWIKQMNKPIFQIYSVEQNGANISDIQKFMTKKQISGSDTKKLTIFDIINLQFEFNWYIKDIQKETLSIVGKKVKKIKNSEDKKENKIKPLQQSLLDWKQYGFIASHQQIGTKKRVIIKATLLNIVDTIWVGLITENIKIDLYQQKINANNFSTYGLIGYQLGNQPYTYGRVFYKGKKVLQQAQQLFLDKEQFIGIEANAQQQKISIYQGYKIIYTASNCKELLQNKVYLCVVLGENQDSIEIFTS